METLNAMMEVGVIPVFYNADLETAQKIAGCCAEGGARVIEFTNRGDFAFEVFGQLEKFCRQHMPQLILGVGSVVDAPTAALYINSGANFVVGPLLNAEVARLCNRRKIPYSPGCGSASEIAQAEELGCEIVKVFPGGQVGGPAFVKNMLGPCPWSSLMPTGGVDATRESISAWLKAGVVCMGMGSNLITKDLVAAKDWAGLTRKIKETLAIVAEVRAELKK
jgi:2-dehydro-3-deoxyphosphogluconate aldolase/(4S)-4-hydroxy-2-oxoglutarate aldolase